jgi:hypothetical protein
MLTSHGHLTYCSNIHAGENWDEHFEKLKENIPLVKKAVSPLQPFGIGLRLSNIASLELRKEKKLQEFQSWLNKNDCYVFTMNGFPYGNFHHAKVKDKVHAPDWTQADRVSYTIRLAQLLSVLLPADLDGGISTSPLSYRFWFTPENQENVFEIATLNILLVVSELIRIKRSTGKLIHLDIEPEPDGLLGEGKEFIDWFVQYLLPMGIPFLQDRFGLDDLAAETAIREHVQLCYDVCHFAVCYEDHEAILQQIRNLGIKTGKIQISAALKATLEPDPIARKEVIDAFSAFNEPTYLHQVVALRKDGSLQRYPDLPDALTDAGNQAIKEWRAHFHVPLFIENYGVLQSTRQDIQQVLTVQQQVPFTTHLEIETYTWEVLPDAMRLPLTGSIIREIQWVVDLLNNSANA